MNNYRLLGLLVVCTFLLLIILSFQFGSEGGNLILTYNLGLKYSLKQFRIFLIIYAILISGLTFLASGKATIAAKFFWLYISLLIIPLTLFTFFTTIPEWTILLIGDYRGRYSNDYYDYINDYGILNICLIILNLIGLIMFGIQTIKKLK